MNRKDAKQWIRENSGLLSRTRIRPGMAYELRATASNEVFVFIDMHPHGFDVYLPTPNRTDETIELLKQLDELGVEILYANL